MNDWKILHGKGFKVRVDQVCARCGKKAVTIQEPAETGKYLCRRCTKMGDDQFVAKAKSVTRGQKWA